MGVEPGPVGYSLAYTNVAVHAGALQNDANALAQRARALRRVKTEHRNAAAAADPVALKDLNGRRLPSAVGAKQAENLAFCDLKADAANGLVFVVELVQVGDRDCWLCAGHRAMIAARCCNSVIGSADSG